MMREVFTEHENEIHNPWSKSNVSQHNQSFEKSPNTDRQSKAYLSLSISTALGCVYGIVIICTESKPTQLHDVSHHDSLDTRRLDKPD
jgi:hypothetical protein